MCKFCDKILKKPLTSSGVHGKKPLVMNVNPSPIHNRLRKGVLFVLATLVLPLFISQANAINLTLSHSPDAPGVLYNLSWEAVAPSTTGATVRYFVFQEFGYDTIDGASAATTSSATFTTLETSVSIERGNGSRCFIVISSDSAGGSPETSDEICHGFIHNLQSEGIQRADGDGTQRGVDQQWTFTYSLDKDAYMTAAVYPPGTSFTTDSNGFVVSAGSPIVKSLVHLTPRSGELGNHNITMEERWDSRNSSGAIVGNGIYYLLLQATMDSGQFPGGLPPESRAVVTPETLLRAGDVYTIPVDILRILNLSATGITLNNPTSLITYELTGGSLVRIVIARPGSGFVVDVNGNIQPYNLTTNAIDSSLIVSTFSFQRQAGSNTEAWDGTSSTGAVVPSGVYAVGISATDEFGNHAIDNSGNDFPIFTTLTLERSAGSNTGGNTQTDLTPPSLVSVTPSSGSVLSTSLSTITVVLADADSPLNLSGSNITVLDPNNTTVARTLSNDGNATLTATFQTPLDTNGAYRITVDAVDTAGNSATFIIPFSIIIGLSQGDFENSTILYPNPAQNTAATIQYVLGVASSVEIEIFNILGHKVRSFTRNDGAGIITQSWDLRNAGGERVGSGVYLVRIKATGNGNTVETTKKLVVIQ